MYWLLGYAAPPQLYLRPGVSLDKYKKADTKQLGASKHISVYFTAKIYLNKLQPPFANHATSQGLEFIDQSCLEHCQVLLVVFGFSDSGALNKRRTLVVEYSTQAL